MDGGSTGGDRAGGDRARGDRSHGVRAHAQRHAPAWGREGGGDTACWLERVCDTCGGLADGPPAPVCERCGTSRP